MLYHHRSLFDIYKNNLSNIVNDVKLNNFQLNSRDYKLIQTY